MPEYDGTYTLGVEIDTTQAKKELDNLAKDTTKSINKNDNTIQPKVDVNKLKEQLKTAKSEYDKLVSDIKENPIYSIDEKDAENYLKIAREELGRITKSSSYAKGDLSEEDTKRVEALKEYIGYVNDWNKLSSKIKGKEEEIANITNLIAENEKKAEESRKEVASQPKQTISKPKNDVKDTNLNPQLVFGAKAKQMQQAQQKTLEQIRKQQDALKKLEVEYKAVATQSSNAIDQQKNKVTDLQNLLKKTSTVEGITSLSATARKEYEIYNTYVSRYKELEQEAEKLRAILAANPSSELTKNQLSDVVKEMDLVASKSNTIVEKFKEWKANPNTLPEIKKISDAEAKESDKLQDMKSKAEAKEVAYTAKRKSLLEEISSLTQKYNTQKGEAALAGENTVVGQLLGLLKGANGKGIKSIIDGISTALVALPEPITTTIGLVIKLAGVLGIVTIALNVIKKILDGIFGVIKKIIGIALQLVKNALGKVLAKFKELTKRTNLFGTIFHRMFRKISTSLKRRLFYGVITRAIGNLRNALVNLIKTDDEVKKSIGQTKGNLMTAFAPIYSFILPAIQRLMSALVQLSAMLARITSGLFGKTTKQSAELAKSLEEQAKAGSSASQSLASFDKLNTISTGGGGDTITPIYDLMSDLFKNSQLEQYVKRLRGILANLWAPFKRSWDKYGKTTWDKVKTTLATILDLILDVGETFSKIWNFGGSGMGVGGHSGGYGDSILGHLWVSLQNILDGVTSLLESLGEAWAEYGEPISTNILRIVDTVSSHIENITGRFKKWAKNIDFKPLLRGINDVVEALEPLADKVGEGLEQFANDVLFPLGNWLIEKGIPAVLRLTGDMIQRIADKIDVFNKVMGRVWDKYLSPFISNVGNDILYILNSAHVTLSILNSDTDATTFKFALLSGAIDGIITGFRTLKDMIIGYVGGAFVLLISKSINLHDAIRFVVDIIRNLIVGTHELIIILRQLSNGEIGAVASKLASAFSQIKSWAQDLYNKIIGWINGVIDAIGKVISRLGDGISQFGAFGGAGGHVLQQLGEAVQTIDIAVNPTPSKPSKSSSSSSGLPSGYSSVSDYVEAQRKKLKIKGHANGNVVPPNVAPYLAILGDNNKETEIVSPLSTMKQAMIEAMSESGFGGGGTFHIHLDVDGREIASVVKQQSDIYKKRTGRSLLV